MIRPARDDDYHAFTTLFPELRVDDPVPTREKWVAELVPSTLVVEAEGAVVAYAWYQAFSTEGIVRHVVVSPAAQGRGVGRALLLEVARALRAKGLGRWALNVKPDNAPALSLYRKLGFVEAFRSVALRFEWTLVDGLPRPEALEPFEPVAADDALVEVEQRLPRGSLALHRAIAGRVLRGVRREGRVVGAAVFVSSFPGAYPFRADDLAVARSLLEALRPVASSPVMNVVVEGQPALAEGLVALGAAVRLDILHLEGPLPG
ncbi:MAG: GNAT family N-acetyltransferase [Myxococcaceae bacterium]|jgi:GNAT superfamily N-acetyltransferase|nr:GNAT family N-acetyltransferase [Myxococcaceae bacterium]